MYKACLARRLNARELKSVSPTLMIVQMQRCNFFSNRSQKQGKNVLIIREQQEVEIEGLNTCVYLTRRLTARENQYNNVSLYNKVNQFCTDMGLALSPLQLCHVLLPHNLVSADVCTEYILYRALVEYASSVWDPHTTVNIYKLESTIMALSLAG